MTKQLLQEMFDNAVHVGHRTQKWNPLMKKYIYGERNGLHVINLESTHKLLEEALTFMKRLVSEGKTILFVSTKPQTVVILKELADKLNMPYVSSKWISGLLTNHSTLKTRIKYFTDIKSKSASGELEKYTKKEVAKMKKQIEKMDLGLGGVEFMKGLPDAVFIVDALRDDIVVKEANKLNIPVIGLVDTNVNPSLVNYPIPANDDALKSLSFLFGIIEKELMKSKKPSRKV